MILLAPSALAAALVAAPSFSLPMTVSGTFSAPVVESTAGPATDDSDLDRLASAAGTDVKVLIDVSLRAEEAGDLDRALWFAKIAVAVAGDGRQKKTARTRWVEARKAAAAPEEDPVKLLAGFSKQLFQIADACGKHRLYANAADVLNQCRGTAYEGAAQKKLTKLFKSPKAIEALLASGVPVDVQRRKRLSKKRIAKIDADHANWENALEVEGDNYLVRTDMGYEMAHSILDAMEQINLFYRKVFGLRRKGMRKCTVNVYKSREEFDEFAFDEDDDEDNSSVLGYYWRVDNGVHTYDTSVHERFGPEELWSTLFHEASHQFTAAIWKLNIPTWLNEGTGSYFEGAELLAGGFIGVNRIPDDRLESLVAMIGAGSEDGRSESTGDRQGPSLKSVISHFDPGSYDGSYYPFGWGLVYFCRNYENDKSERVYLSAYESFMRSYTQGSGERNCFKRFEEYFIEKAKVPGIDRFSAFEQLWESWIRDLNVIHFGGEEQADVLIARGRKQLADDFPSNAVDSFRWATEKNPLNATGWLELGRAASHKDVELEDAAVYAYRRLLALALRQPDAVQPLEHFDGSAAEAAIVALKGIKSIDASIARALKDKITPMVEIATAAAEGYVEAGFPLTAIAFIRDVDALLDGRGNLRKRIHELAEEHEVDGRLKSFLPIDEELSAWKTGDEGWSATSSGGIQFEGDDALATLRLSEPPAKVFRFEARVQHDGALVGLLFDGQLLEESYYVADAEGFCALVTYDPDPKAAAKRGGSPFETLAVFENGLLGEDENAFTLAIDVEHTQTRLFVDGELVGTFDVPAEAMVGRIGLFVQGDGATFTDISLAY